MAAAVPGRCLRVLADHGQSTLLIDHDMGLVGICDRVVVPEFGRVIADGEPEAVRRDPRVIAAYLGGGDRLASAADSAATGQGERPTKAARQRRTLDGRSPCTWLKQLFWNPVSDGSDPSPDAWSEGKTSGLLVHRSPLPGGACRSVIGLGLTRPWCRAVGERGRGGLPGK
jgi:hypothetical protein